MIQRKFNIGDHVTVTSNCTSYGQSGVVTKLCRDKRYVVVELDSGILRSYNTLSLKITEEEGVLMKGYKVAIVNLMEDYTQKDYGFALYDDNVVLGSVVVVNPRDRYALGTVKKIVDKADYGKLVTKEVICVVDETAYRNRVDERKKVAAVAQEKKDLIAKIEARISAAQDIDYYARAAEAFKDRDPELVSLVARLKEIA